MNAMFFLATLQTNHGGWSARPCVLVFVAAVGVALWIRSVGRGDTRTGGDSQKPFISGNDLANPEDARVAASHMYWGFLEALRGYYSRLMEFHSGVLTDYVMWFLVVLAVLMAAGWA